MERRRVGGEPNRRTVHGAASWTRIDSDSKKIRLGYSLRSLYGATSQAQTDSDSKRALPLAPHAPHPSPTYIAHTPPPRPQPAKSLPRN